MRCRTLRTASVFLAALTLPWLTGCHATPSAPSAAAVETLLDSQRGAWAAGDFESFVSTYWQSDAMTFVGSRGLVHGTSDLVANYEAGYPDAAARGELTFELLEVRPLAPPFALVIGLYHLRRPEVGDDDGIFTLIVEHRPEGLRIVHDHSSRTARPSESG